MVTVEEKIKEIEDEIGRTQYNKATEHHVGRLKAKIARLREILEGQGKKGGGEGYSVKSSGDATVGIVGPPSAGKSTLLNQLTNAESKVAEYEFTTLNVVPGMMLYNGAQIQILDLPGLIKGAAEGKGKGKEVLSVVRNCNLILILVDPKRVDMIEDMKKELYSVGIRLDRKKPRIFIKKTIKGGIFVESTVALTKLNNKVISSIFEEYGLHNANILIKEDASVDDLIDVLSKNCVYVPSITAINKIDTDNNKGKYPKEWLLLSAINNLGLDKLKEEIFKKLNFCRIYLKRPDEEAKTTEPMIFREKPDLRKLCRQLHKDFLKNFKYARIWGSTRFLGQKVIKLDYGLQDGDIVELHLL